MRSGGCEIAVGHLLAYGVQKQRERGGRRLAARPPPELAPHHPLGQPSFHSRVSVNICPHSNSLQKEPSAPSLLDDGSPLALPVEPRQGHACGMCSAANRTQQHPHPPNTTALTARSWQPTSPPRNPKLPPWPWGWGWGAVGIASPPSAAMAQLIPTRCMPPNSNCPPSPAHISRAVLADALATAQRWTHPSSCACKIRTLIIIAIMLTIQGATTSHDAATDWITNRLHAAASAPMQNSTNTLQITAPAGGRRSRPAPLPPKPQFPPVNRNT